MRIKMFTKIPPWYVRYEEAKVDRSAIMQDFRDHEKKITRLHKSRSSRDELEFDLGNFV